MKESQIALNHVNFWVSNFFFSFSIMKFERTLICMQNIPWGKLSKRTYNSVDIYLNFFFIYNQWLLPWWYLYDVIINSKKTRLWKFYLIELDGISRVIFCINVSIYYTNKIHLKYLMYVLSKEKIKHEKYIKTLWPQTRIIHLKYLMYVFFCFS